MATSFGDQSAFADQVCDLFRVHVVMMASPVLSDGQLGVRTTDPVQLEANRRWVVGRVGDDLFEDSSQEASSRKRVSPAYPIAVPDRLPGGADVHVVQALAAVPQSQLRPRTAPSRRHESRRCSIASPTRQRRADFPVL